jgi:hypothetical protein
MASAARAMAMAMRAAGNEEGKGGKAMAMGTRVAGKQWQQQRCGRWQQQQGWWTPSLSLASGFDSSGPTWELGHKRNFVMAFLIPTASKCTYCLSKIMGQLTTVLLQNLNKDLEQSTKASVGALHLVMLVIGSVGNLVQK